MVVFAFLCITVASAVVGWLLFGHYAILFYWNGELNKALALMQSDSAQGRAQVEKVFNDAIQAKVAPDILMRMYRVYGMALYQRDELDRADEQVDKAIKLGANDPTSPAIADQLCHAWQDRATERHYHWLKDPKVPDGAKDQEMSAKVAEAAFGPDHEQTIYKVSGLAKIYADVGRFADADKIIDRCIKSVTTKESSRQCAWYVYAMAAHVRAVEHRYKDAVTAYLKVRQVAGNESDSERGWSEFYSGMRLHQADRNPLLKQARVLLNKGKYAELDQLAEKLIKDKTAYWDGYWALAFLITPLEFGSGVDDIWFNQLKLDLNTWLAKNPKSSLARSALANLHIFRAWEIQENEENESKLSALFDQAKKILAVDPSIGDKTPTAWVPLIRLTYLTHDKNETLKVNANAIKRWPNYFGIDTWTLRLLRPGVMGAEGDQQRYINKRAASMGGAQGDVLYARCAWYFYEGDQAYKVFGEKPMDWERIKRGFRQIFKDYPKESAARLAFIQLALNGDHDDDAVNMEW